MAAISTSRYLSDYAWLLLMLTMLTDIDRDMDRAIAAIHELPTGGAVHLIGNGGSAAVVAHTQNGFQQACGIRALVHQDIPTLTAFANDKGYDDAYASSLDVWVQRGDVLIAVSSSGASPNIIAAVEVARRRGAFVITCSGFNSTNPLRHCGDVNFYVPSDKYGYVELTHEALLHCLTDRIANAR